VPGRSEADPVASAPPPSDPVCFRVEPFDTAAIAHHVAVHGVAAGPVASRYGVEGEGPSIYITDPEGNAIELTGPPDESPAPG
jgi:hypothetical protein